MFGNTQIYWGKVGSSRLPNTASVMSLTLQDEIIGILKITKALRDYSGAYYCIVENERGIKYSLPAHVQVKGNI